MIYLGTERGAGVEAGLISGAGAGEWAGAVAGTDYALPAIFGLWHVISDFFESEDEYFFVAQS